MCSLIGKTVNHKAEAYYRKDNWPSDSAYIYEGALSECMCHKKLWFYATAFKRRFEVESISETLKSHCEPHRKAHHSIGYRRILTKILVELKHLSQFE